jgi:molecular chaperone DnaK (HSP70)
LGGVDFTERLISRLMCSILNKKDPSDFEGLRMECERVKILLASNENEVLTFKSSQNDSTTTLNVTLANYEEMCEKLLNKIQPHLKVVLKDAGLKPIDIDEIYLVGDSTRLPFIKSLLNHIFVGKKLVHLGDNAVARGCALQAGNSKDLDIVDITAGPLEMDFKSAWVYQQIVPKHSQIPYQYKTVMSRVYPSRCAQLKFNLHENLNGYKIPLNEYVVTFTGRTGFVSVFELTFTVDGNGLTQCFASTTLPDGEFLQLQVSDNSSNNMSFAAIECAANEIAVRHDYEENRRRCIRAKNEFVKALLLWSEPFKKTRYNDKFAAKFYEKFYIDQKWLTTTNEREANVVERRLEEFKSYCSTTLEEAIANLPSWVKNLYDIKKVNA